MVIAPASGRQLGTLKALFRQCPPEAYIAENGPVVAHCDEVVSTTPIADDDVARLLHAANQTPAVTVVCQPEVAYVRPTDDEAIAREIAKYYRSRRTVSDLGEALGGGVVKLALYSETDVEETVAPVLRAAAGQLNVSVSGAHWVDVMNPQANKGIALNNLAGALGVEQAETAAFGDYFNDYELLQAAGTAYAMANAHPGIKEIADHVIGSNAEHAVITEFEKMLG
ncbi:HAD-IIB family hydrolase [Corynebacterium yudongzhengii]|uniref:HAD-IIB family hydrolase n=1 Tax=Corynebacterium yudongzhengii TaxID=2080740 RepID=UPI0031199424